MTLNGCKWWKLLTLSEFIFSMIIGLNFIVLVFCLLSVLLAQFKTWEATVNHWCKSSTPNLRYKESMSNHAVLNYNLVWLCDIDQFGINIHKYNTKPITRRKNSNDIHLQIGTESLLRYCYILSPIPNRKIKVIVLWTSIQWGLPWLMLCMLFQYSKLE